MFAYLDLPASEERVVQGHGGADRVLIRELDVGEAFGLSVELVAEDGDAVDASAAVEVLLQLLGRRAVINVTDVN